MMDKVCRNCGDSYEPQDDERPEDVALCLRCFVIAMELLAPRLPSDVAQAERMRGTLIAFLDDEK